MPWTYDGHIAAPPAAVAYESRPAVGQRYGAPDQPARTQGSPPALTDVAPAGVYLMIDRHRLRAWSSPDPVRLKVWVDRLDAMTLEDARECVLMSKP